MVNEWEQKNPLIVKFHKMKESYLKKYVDALEKTVNKERERKQRQHSETVANTNSKNETVKCDLMIAPTVKKESTTKVIKTEKKNESLTEVAVECKSNGIITTCKRNVKRMALWFNNKNNNNITLTQNNNLNNSSTESLKEQPKPLKEQPKPSYKAMNMSRKTKALVNDQSSTSTCLEEGNVFAQVSVKNKALLFTKLIAQASKQNTQYDSNVELLKTKEMVSGEVVIEKQKSVKVLRDLLEAKLLPTIPLRTRTLQRFQKRKLFVTDYKLVQYENIPRCGLSTVSKTKSNKSQKRNQSMSSTSFYVDVMEPPKKIRCIPKNCLAGRYFHQDQQLEELFYEWVDEKKGIIFDVTTASNKNNLIVIVPKNAGEILTTKEIQEILEKATKNLECRQWAEFENKEFKAEENEFSAEDTTSIAETNSKDLPATPLEVYDSSSNTPTVGSPTSQNTLADLELYNTLKEKLASTQQTFRNAYTLTFMSTPSPSPSLQSEAEGGEPECNITTPLKVNPSAHKPEKFSTPYKTTQEPPAFTISPIANKSSQQDSAYLTRTADEGEHVRLDDSSDLHEASYHSIDHNDNTSIFWIETIYAKCSLNIYGHDPECLEAFSSSFSKKCQNANDIYFGIDNYKFCSNISEQPWVKVMLREPREKYKSHYWFGSGKDVMVFTGPQMRRNEIKRFFKFIRGLMKKTEILRFGIDGFQFPNNYQSNLATSTSYIASHWTEIDGLRLETSDLEQSSSSILNNNNATLLNLKELSASMREIVIGTSQLYLSNTRLDDTTYESELTCNDVLKILKRQHADLKNLEERVKSGINYRVKKKVTKFKSRCQKFVQIKKNS